ncbi:hypothetical protein [Bdellovibrio sp. HCB337]|uniref:hypothetical protein n=1 Tax=Bdellovibrio sp. HCB337 TaxID=3394358 RepID=UPI0039A4B52E
MIKKLILLPLILISESLWANGNTGGMDGGGGGTLPAYPVSASEVREFAEMAKSKLYYLLNGYEDPDAHLSTIPLQKKLFGGPRKAQEVLNDLRLEVRENAPCLTSNGTEVDASIHALKPNTICLSADRISKKIDKAMVEREVLALLMHEVAHFMGADEAEATELQQDIAWRIMNSDSGDAINEEKLRDEISYFFWNLAGGIEAVEAGNFVDANMRLDLALFRLTTWEGEAVGKSYVYKLYGNRESNYLSLLRIKVVKANEYIKSLIPGPDQEKNKIRYELPFEGRDYFLNSDDSFDTDPYADEKIMKLKSSQDALNLLKELEKEYAVRQVFTQQTAFGMRAPMLNGHLTIPTQNPWENFVGTYAVQSVQCDVENGFNKEVEFQVYKADDKLYFKRATASSSGSDAIVFGAYHVNTFVTNYGKTSDGGAFMTNENGGSWSSRGFGDTRFSEVRLKTNSDKTFELTQVYKYLPQDVSKTDFVQTCVYKGIVQ